jgi:hypothetical protein
VRRLQSVCLWLVFAASCCPCLLCQWFTEQKMLISLQIVSCGYGVANWFLPVRGYWWRKLQGFSGTNQPGQPYTLHSAGSLLPVAASPWTTVPSLLCPSGDLAIHSKTFGVEFRCTPNFWSEL